MVISAQGLALTDGTAANPEAGDPFVIAYWRENQVYRSHPVVKTTDPVWDDDQSTVISIPPGGGVLRVEVFDWDQDNPKKLGRAPTDDFMGGSWRPPDLY